MEIPSMPVTNRLKRNIYYASDETSFRSFFLSRFQGLPRDARSRSTWSRILRIVSLRIHGWRRAVPKWNS